MLYLISFLLGGLFLTVTMQKKMMVEHKLDGSFNDVKKALEEIVPQFKGWSFPLPHWDFYKSQLSKNLTYDNINNMVMCFVCNPKHANTILRVVPKMGAMMPCTWALYETKKGEVYIAKMNIALMSNMFFGVTRKIMKKVAMTEKEILKQLKSRLASPKNSPKRDLAA